MQTTYVARAVSCWLMIVACLLVWPGCTAEHDAAIDPSSAEPSATAASTDHRELGWQGSALAMPESAADSGGLDPEWSEPSTSLPDSPPEMPDVSPFPDMGTASHEPFSKAPSPDEYPSLAAPDYALPSVVPEPFEPTVPEPVSAARNPLRPAPVAPENLFEPDPSHVTQPRSESWDGPPSFSFRPQAIASPQPFATEPESMAGPLAPRSMPPLEAMAMEPDTSSPRPEAFIDSRESYAAVREPFAARTDGDAPRMGHAAASPPSTEAPPDASPQIAEAVSGGANSGDEARSGADADYKVVKVFYGTDRKAQVAAAPRARAYLGWFYLTVVSAAVTAILMLMAYRLSRKLPVLVLAGAGVLVTLMLGVVTTVARLQGEPPGPRPDRSYGDGRGEMEMGVCEVSIPERHQPGQIERPSVFRFEFVEDPTRHVVVLGIDEQPSDAFFAALRNRVEASRKKEAFVFVHGYNVTFDEAAQRTAQLAYDLEFDGAPIFFSWPSQGGLLQYAVDETNVVWTVPHLKEFLIGVARQSGAKQVHLIAHSMGNRALTSALQMLSYEMRDEMPMFNQVVLTAPDIDAEVFQRDIVPAITPTAERLTLYASSNDEALKLSKQLHGYRRAGDSGYDLLVIPGVDTIDVSMIDTSLLGHEYYGNNTTVIADMLDLINESKPPQLRPWLQARQWGELMYWVFQANQAAIGISQPPNLPPRR